MGAESIQELLKAIDLDKDAETLKRDLKDASGQKRARIIKRLEVVEAFRGSGNLSGMDDSGCYSGYSAGHPSNGSAGRRRFATSDLNDLYRRIINRNNRLKRLLNWALRILLFATKNVCSRKRLTP